MWGLTSEDKNAIVGEVVRPNGGGLWYAGFSQVLKGNRHFLDAYLKKTEEEMMSLCDTKS